MASALSSGSDEDTVFQVGQSVTMSIFAPLPEGGYKIRSEDGQLWVMTRAPYRVPLIKKLTPEEELVAVNARLAILEKDKKTTEETLISMKARFVAMETQNATFWHLHWDAMERLGNVERQRTGNRRRHRHRQAQEASTAE